MTTDWLVNSNFGRICLVFGTAVDSANSNFGWSSLGKPARLPGAVDSLPPPRRAASALMMGTARLLAWRKARPCRRRAPAAAVRSSRILRTSSSAALAASAAALISAKCAAFCSSHCSLLARANESFDFALRSKLRMPGRNFFEHGLTDNSIRTCPSEV
jgi:hypothetical protein